LPECFVDKSIYGRYYGFSLWVFLLVLVVVPSGGRVGHRWNVVEKKRASLFAFCEGAEADDRYLGLFRF